MLSKIGDEFSRNPLKHGVISNLFLNINERGDEYKLFLDGIGTFLGLFELSTCWLKSLYGVIKIWMEKSQVWGWMVG